MTLQPDRYREIVAAEATRLSAIDEATLPTAIEHIEGWTVHSVVGHTAWVMRYVVQCLRAGPDERVSRSSIGEPPVGSDVLGWLGEAADELQLELATTDVEVKRPTWTGPQPGLWWLRRIAQEMAMHRWDAQAASSEPVPIDVDLARDGIDEVLEVFVPNRMQFDTLSGASETIHLHSTDADDGEWMLTLGPSAVDWERGHAKGDVAARGAMSDLLLLLWSRIPPARLDTFGDADLLNRWQAAAKF